MKAEFKPIAMRCNKEQFEAINPKLEKAGIEINPIDFEKMKYLVNDLGYSKIVDYFTSVGTSHYKYYETWDEATFLRCCGIEVEETFTVSKEFVLEAHKSACSTWKSKIEKEFPQLFESKLEVGRWYKNGVEGWSKSIAFVEEINPDDKDEFRGYGFDVNGDWIKKDGYVCGSSNWILATESEVKTALIAEARRREGLKRELVLFLKVLTTE